jgi:DNA-binding transcriptional ArsR family regulator
VPEHAQVLTALADPTRRLLVDRLRDRPHSVSDLADGLPVSRPAVSQHLAVLKEGGLVSEERAGRRRIYHLETAGLVPLRAYVEGLWEDALSAYARAADDEARDAGHDGGRR